MIDLSVGGLIGAIVGTVIAAAIYGKLIAVIERRVRGWRVPRVEDRAGFEQELALLRRGILAFDILLFAGLGYWIGDMIGETIGG